MFKLQYCTKFGQLILRKMTKILAIMSYFKAKVHQIRFLLGLCSRSRWLSSQHSPNSLTGFDRVLLLREGKGVGCIICAIGRCSGVLSSQYDTSGIYTFLEGWQRSF